MWDAVNCKCSKLARIALACLSLNEETIDMENVAIWNLAGKRWQESPTWATRLELTQMYKWFSFWQIKTCRDSSFVRFPTQHSPGWSLMFFAAFLCIFEQKPSKSLALQNPASGKGVALWSFLRLKQSIGAVMTNKNIPSMMLSVWV